MSHSQVAPPHGTPVPTGPAKRPGTLTTLLVVTVLSAVSAFVGAVISFAGGTEFADQNLKDAIAQDPEKIGLPAGTTAKTVFGDGALWKSLVEERQDQLVNRAVMAVVIGALLLLFALFARKAATWARVMITIMSVVVLLAHILIAGDYPPDSLLLTSMVAMLTALVAIVFSWLPANGRYAKQLKGL
ncbi:hypothetical protein AB0D04_19790 [Streptomyces sp. NPDC048483]|uniref:hypothetical protein n=1 Tax=Streptomyces sp. NPDC048483 TaxID=3154927 RepID=UPI00341DBBEE